MQINTKKTNSYLNKIIAMMLVMTLTIANFLLVAKESYAIIEVAEENIQTTETGNVKTTISSKVEKYLKIEGVGVLLQVAMDVNIDNPDGKTINSETIEIQVPEISEEKPIQTPELVNNMVGYDLEYKSTGLLTITPTTVNAGTTTYKVVYIYSEEVWNNGQEQQISWQTAVALNIQGNDEENVVINTETATISETGSIVSAEIEVPTEIYKTNMYTQNNLETEYKETWKIETSYLDADENTISIETEPPVMIDENESEQQVTSKIYYTETKLGMNMLERVFGEGYEITIISQDASGNSLQTQTININTQEKTEENTTITITHPERTEKIKIETSNIINTVQAFEVENTKKIVTSTTDPLSQIKQISETIKVNNNETTSKIELKDPTLNATVGLKDKTILSAVDGKQDVDIVVTLVTNSEERDLLYNNPTFEIQMPEGVTVNAINDYNLTLASGLNKNNASLLENGNIQIKLSGEQTEYIESNLNAQIIINVNIEVSKLIANKTDTIKMSCNNSNLQENGSSESQSITIKSSNEKLVTYLKVENYDGNQGVIEKFSDNVDYAAEKINMFSDAVTINVTGIIINNYEEDINSLEVELVADRNGTEIFNESNTDSNAVSLAKGQVVQITRQIEIPANLAYNEVIGLELKCKNLDNSEQQNALIELYTEQEEGIALMSLTEENSQLISVGIVTKLGDGTALQDGDSIYEEEIVEYTISITNLTNEAIQNFNVTAVQTNGVLYDLKGVEVTNPMIYGDETAIEH